MTTVVNDPVLRDIAQLSAGTMATISGKRLYVEVDALRDTFFEWATTKVASGVTFETWQDAWEAYKCEHP